MMFSIGHSTRSQEDFVRLLKAHQVTRLVDIRSMPGSTRYPHFNDEVMPVWLADWGIKYSWLPALGGKRRKQRTIPPEVNSGWRNTSFHNYADYGLSDEFEAGLKRLQDMAGGIRLAFMCSEAVPWRCHRLLVSNALVHRGVPVQHIISISHAEQHRLGMYGAPPEPRGALLVYPKTLSEV